MRKIYSVLILLNFSIFSFSQNNSFCPTYVYEGFIKTENGKKIEINMNFLVLLDSTLVGSYYYKASNGSLKLVGKLKNDNTFNLIERDDNEIITGIFDGKMNSKKDSIFGTWTTPKKEKSYNFKLNLVEGKSYWDFIRKNRALFEYQNLKFAIKEKEKVLSIDVASQELNSLPKEIATLPNIVSINLLGNNFKTFPKELCKLQTLDEISLSSNQLENVTSEIGNLKNLRILIMNNNQLKLLPKEIGKLTKLLYLEIGNNRLTSLPQEIKYLTSLQELHIERNNLNEDEKRKIKKSLPNCIIHF